MPRDLASPWELGRASVLGFCWRSLRCVLGRTTHSPSRHVEPMTSAKDRGNQRGSVGIVCSVVPGSNGSIRLVMDDAASPSRSFPQQWQVETLFTWHEYDEASVLDVALTERELADIGLSLISRLSALVAMQKNKP